MKLHQYQERAINFWINNPSTYFAIDPGLGKTAIGLHTIERLQSPTLVLAPSKTIYNTWPDEIKKWNLDLSYTIIHRKESIPNLSLKCDVYLANYESLHLIYRHLLELSKKHLPMPFSVLVIDEGSMVKNRKTKRFDYLKAIRGIFSHVAILSGTPSPNGLQDLWSQYYILNRGKLLHQNFSAFKNKYFYVDDYNPYEMFLKPGAKEQIFKAVAPVTFRLDKKDYLELPEIVFNTIKLPLPGKIRKVYDTLKKHSIIKMKETTCAAMNAASLSMKLRQLLQGFLYMEDEQDNRVTKELHHVKIDALKDLMEQVNQPILCAIQFKYELEMILEAVPGTPSIHGGTSDAQATQYIDSWNRGDIPLLICHPASLSHGVNLQSGGNVILWYCQTWSVEQFLQFNARLHRQGQKNGVVVHSLVIEDSIDERVSRVLRNKEVTQQELLDFLRDENNY